jgi:hypothetical protein
VSRFLIALAIASVLPTSTLAQETSSSICERLGIDQRQARLETRIEAITARRASAQQAMVRATAALRETQDCESDVCLRQVLDGYSDLPGNLRDDLMLRSAEPNWRRLVVSTLLSNQGQQNARVLVEVSTLNALLMHKQDLAAIRFECTFQQTRQDLGFVR